ncbi:MAG: penicillin-binding protein 1A [Halioglobus sp.]
MSFLRFILRLGVLGFLAAIWLLAGVYLYLSPNLPDVETLRDVKLQTPMRVYTADDQLIGQFGEQKRSPLLFNQIPEQFVNALLAAEDDNFFNHRGIDLMGLARAVSELLLTGEKGSGGSTLTMQVARNYFLTLDRTFIRKFNEILLAIEIERALSKEEIFELYFNRVFLGHRAYGFQAASQVYYGKGITELSLAQHAMLAGIPKAPSRNNPISGPTAGEQRRNWILGRMQALGYISGETQSAARKAPVTARHHGARLAFSAHYAAEMARQEMLERYAMDAYTNGYRVYTTVDSRLQEVARRAVIDGLLTYDERHGYRGPERKVEPDISEEKTRKRYLEVLAKTAVIADLQPAIVTSVEKDTAQLLFEDGSEGSLAFTNGVEQARPYRGENRRGPNPESIGEVLAPGYLIRVMRDADDALHLKQVPAAQAALVSLNPKDGAIVSIVGGMGFELSKFNRATQAQRQPGSNFKPFLYAAALENGYTAASIINDAPVVMEDRSLEDVWRPENDGGKFYGPTRLRWALTKSRNLVSIRLLQSLGVDNLIDYAGQLGFNNAEFSRDLSLALGTHAMSPIDLATGYATLANGGYRVEPYLISRIEDVEGNVLYQARPATVCPQCAQSDDTADARELSMEQILAKPIDDVSVEPAKRVMDERVNFIITSILKDVITRGTGRRALSLERSDIAGKTGTTNGPKDAWFSGYSPDLVTTTWVGFDNYTSLGRREFGGTAALPIWIDYMREALKAHADVAPLLPQGLASVKIDATTGLLARSGQTGAVSEYFREEFVPARSSETAAGIDADPKAEELIGEIF